MSQVGGDMKGGNESSVLLPFRPLHRLSPQQKIKNPYSTHPHAPASVLSRCTCLRNIILSEA